MATHNLPGWYARIDAMEASPPHIRQNPFVVWLPPRRLGRNLCKTRYMSPGLALKFDGQGTNGHSPHMVFEPERLPLHLLNQEPFQTYSAYVGHQGHIFTVPYDATAEPVWNGVDNDDNGDDHPLRPGRRPRSDWRSLGFDRVEGSPGTSYATHDGTSHTLYAWHEDSNWPNQLVPAIYKGTEMVQDDDDGGALVGDIALLVALLALSLPEANVMAILPRLIERSWRCPPADILDSERVGRRPGHRRGVVVKVWINMRELDLSQPTHLQAWRRYHELMQRYQNGYFGVHFGQDA